MGESRSVLSYQRHFEAAQKFDYFVAGLTGALCAYIAQSLKPQKIVPGIPEVLEIIALLVLFAAAVASFKYIELKLIVLRSNTEWLDVLEKRGAMAEAMSKENVGLMFNSESGEVFSPFHIMQRYQAIGEIEPEMRKKLEGEVARTGRLYKWRNRLLFVGFLILVAARFTAFSWW